MPDRLAHWLPRRASAFAVGLAIGFAALLATHDIARADQTSATTSPQAARSRRSAVTGLAQRQHNATAPRAASLSLQDQQAAAQAMRLHWNDWAAHYNIAAAQIAQGNWNYAVAHAATAFLLDPTFGANRDNLRFAIQQSGSMDPTLRRLLYGPWFQQFPGLLSPAGWQRVSLFASLVLAAGFSALIVMLYLPARRGPCRSVAGTGSPPAAR